MPRISISHLLFCVFLLLAHTAHALGQSADGRWLRIATGEYSTVEVDKTSLKFGHDNSIIAVFRTTETGSEDNSTRISPNESVRLDTVEFSAKKELYRVLDSRIVGERGILSAPSRGGNSSEWKRLRGRTALLMFAAVTQLNPYGEWRVVSYRYANGQPSGAGDPDELKRLIGKDVSFGIGKVAVGDQSCAVSDFEGRTVSDSDWRAYFGSSPRDLGLDSGRLEAVRFGCGKKEGVSQRSFLLRLGPDRALLLWDGVFLELKRLPTRFII